MKKLLLIGAAILVLLLALNRHNGTAPVKDIEKSTNIREGNPAMNSVADSSIKRTLFVPYWNIPEPNTNITSPSGARPDTIAYFGITPGDSGINKSEPGYNKLDSFRAIGFPGATALRSE